MRREDEKVIRALSRLDGGGNFLRNYMALPFIPVSGYEYETRDVLIPKLTAAEIRDIAPFHEFIFHRARDSGNEDTHGTVIIEMRLDSVAADTLMEKIPFVITVFFAVDNYMWSDREYKADKHVLGTPVSFAFENMLGESYMLSLLNNADSHRVLDSFAKLSDKAKENTLAQIAMWYVRAIDYLTWTAQQNLFPIEKRDNPAPRKKGAGIGTKKPWTRTDLPRVLFLNQLPHEKRETSLPTGRHVTGHNRRAHWRHLTADRYKEKRRVRIPSTWVGEKSATFCGATYKLLER